MHTLVLSKAAEHWELKPVSWPDPVPTGLGDKHTDCGCTRAILQVELDSVMFARTNVQSHEERQVLVLLPAKQSRHL